MKKQTRGYYSGSLRPPKGLAPYFFRKAIFALIFILFSMNATAQINVRGVARAHLKTGMEPILVII